MVDQRPEAPEEKEQVKRFDPFAGAPEPWASYFHRGGTNNYVGWVWTHGTQEHVERVGARLARTVHSVVKVDSRKD